MTRFVVPGVSGRDDILTATVRDRMLSKGATLVNSMLSHRFVR